MADLPAPAPRKAAHTRRLKFEGFLRDDGLWDFDCELQDVKAHPFTMIDRGTVEPGTPIHLIRVRLTIDDSYTIRDAQAAMEYMPHGECHAAAAAPMRKLVGLTMGAGWRKQIEAAIGGEAGCTHIRELVFNAATAAFQTIPSYRAQESGNKEPIGARGDQPPFYFGQCMTFAFSGPVVKRILPQFHRPAGPPEPEA